MEASKEIRFGIGYDIHQLVEGRDLILGGEKISFSKGLLGHSDADIVIHGIIDALLGALSKGDIGQIFGVDREDLKGVSSLKLLKKVYLIMKEEGFSLNNIDLTIIAQSPKLSSYFTKMKKNIATSLNIKEEKVNIKATTTKGLGVIGRKKAMACLVVASISKI
jgi:2-C-methyl-D-erythritol 2,4-cyclodiphosphate synthase